MTLQVIRRFLLNFADDNLCTYFVFDVAELNLSQGLQSGGAHEGPGEEIIAEVEINCVAVTELDEPLAVILHNQGIQTCLSLLVVVAGVGIGLIRSKH